jgi:proteasome lid subunit RPN8/RPN11
LKARLKRSAYDALTAHGLKDYPHEACGVLLGRGHAEGPEVLEAVACGNANTERAADRYLIEPKDQLRVEKDARARGLDVVGYYHSHPDHPSQASATDLAQSWEGLLYLILAVNNGAAAGLQGWWRNAGEPAFSETKVEFVP